MMSDHWKKLANLLGTPGPADPPETVRTPVPAKEAPPQPAAAPRAAATQPPAASTPAPPAPAAQRPQPPAAPAASSAAPRQRTSMWGDDSESEARGSAAAEAPAPPREERAQPARPRPRREETSDDALPAFGAIKRDPPVPGFELPPGDSPERAAAPPKRSAWDTLIGTLGIKPAAEPEAEPRPPAAPAPARAASTRPPAEELGGPSGFGAGLLEPAEPPRSEPRAGRAPEEQASDEEERPRGFGRRSGSRTRGRGGDEPREATAEIGWGAEPAAPSSRRGPRAAAEAPPVSEPLSGGQPAPGGETRRAALDDDAEGPARRRSRRRGQRQVLAEAGLDRQQLEESPAETRADDEGDAAARSELRPARRDDRRDRGRGRERGRDRDPQSDDVREREPRTEREPRAERPAPAEDRRRGEPRPSRRRHESLDLDLPEEDPLEGFAAGLLAEERPADGDEEPRVRSRRRRGRRGRGGAASREEEGPRGESLHDESLQEQSLSAEDDTWAVVDGPSGFDSGIEEDDEGAEPLRRRARGTRPRNRRDAATTERGESSPAPTAPPSERKAPAKQYNAPTWLDTVSLLVEANVQRRASSGNGRGGRR